MNENQALSDKDIIQFLDKYDIPIKFIPYHQVPLADDIDDILPCICLYELRSNMGHWVAIFRDNNGKINYFDSYGKLPDHWLKEFDTMQNLRNKKDFGADYTHLLKLIVNSKNNKDKSIIFNEFPLQGYGDFTCGYWCAIRVLLNEVGFNNDEFHNLFKKFNMTTKQKKIIALYDFLKDN
jgi:hypothetical protein